MGGGTRKRGGRGEGSRAKRFKKWGDKKDMQKVEAVIKKGLHIHRIEKFPSDFISIKRCGKTVRNIVRKKFHATSTPEQLETLPLEGKILLPLDHLPPGSIPDDIPPYLIMRFEHFITDEQQKGLRVRWDRLVASQPKHLLKADKNRSATDAFHFGTWEVTGACPRITGETEAQSPEAITAIDDLMCYIKSYIAPKIASVFKDHAPAQWEAILRANARVQRELEHQYLSRPSLNMGGPFFTVAAKESGSGVVHIDWNDDRALYAFIFAVGDWEGGEFCVPQLGIKIPMRPGQVIAVLARVLAHFSAPVTTGRRIVFTCFTDHLLFRHGKDTDTPVVVLG
ncbi:hypothetical protein P692DRAFT_20875242 [Suillus brevipes Sb2]|nr:hypothetical protein P692DRAFT_20875242 [Suillus brevipes Sb2]